MAVSVEAVQVPVQAQALVPALVPALVLVLALQLGLVPRAPAPPTSPLRGSPLPSARLPASPSSICQGAAGLRHDQPDAKMP